MINGESVTIEQTTNAEETILKRELAAQIRFIEDGFECAELRAGQLPVKLAEFLEGYFKHEASKINIAQNETARRLWDEYAEGPHGGWRAAGKTSERNLKEFANALGEASLTVFLDHTGGAGMVEIIWGNTELFLGHSIFTHIHDPAIWTEFDATLFG